MAAQNALVRIVATALRGGIGPVLGIVIIMEVRP
jgi:hypothetical protein